MHSKNRELVKGWWALPTSLPEASQRPNDKSNWRTGSVTELCKMKALQTLPRVWSNTCSVSRLSWTGSQPSAVCLVPAMAPTCWGARDSSGDTAWRSTMATASPRGTAQPAQSPSTSNTEGVGAGRWEDALKQDTETSPGRSLRSAGRAALAGGNTLTATHSGRCCAVQNVITLLWGESLPFPQHCHTRVFHPWFLQPGWLGRFEFTQPPCPPAAHRSSPCPLRGLTPKGLLEQQQHLHAWAISISTPLPTMLHRSSIHPSICWVHKNPVTPWTGMSHPEVQPWGAEQGPLLPTGKAQQLHTTAQSRQYLDKITKITAFLHQMHWSGQTGAQGLSKGRGWTGTFFDSSCEAQFKGWSPELETKVTQHK